MPRGDRHQAAMGSVFGRGEADAKSVAVWCNGPIRRVYARRRGGFQVIGDVCVRCVVFWPDWPGLYVTDDMKQTWTQRQADAAKQIDEAHRAAG